MKKAGNSLSGEELLAFYFGEELMEGDPVEAEVI